MRQTATEQFYREWEIEPPNGVYPTLDEWGAALAEAKRRKQPERITFQSHPVSARHDQATPWERYCASRGTTPRESPYQLSVSS